MSGLDRAVGEQHRSWVESGLQRHIAPPSPEMTMFASSDYLGLSRHPRVLAAGARALREEGSGSTGSRLTTGTRRAHELLETEFAQFLGYPDAVFFGSGYQANLSTLQLLGTEDVTIFSDADNHASIIDGTRLARGGVVVYPHGNVTELGRLLAARDTPHALVVSDGVFSMSGAVLDISALLDVARRHDAWVMVDDAHGIGTLGATGCGILEHAGIAPGEGPDVLVVTASKALGAEGGVVACSAAVGAWLRQRARSFVFSTSPSPVTVACVREALAVLRESPGLVGRLREVVGRLGAGPSPIIPVPVGDEREAVALSASLLDVGLHVPAIRHPTVPRGRAILRICAQATHTDEDVDRLRVALGL